MQQAGLITGASSGIGWELAKVHAKKGRDVVLVARSEDKLQSLKEEIQSEFDVKVELFPMDLSEEGNIETLYRKLKEQGVRIDYLFNNAGIGDFGNYHELDWGKESKMIDLNIRTLTQMTKLFGSDMVEREKGWIMNVASTAAFQPGPLMSVYYATKAYVLTYSEGVGHEWKNHGVNVSVLCPGPTESDFVNEANLNDSKLFSRVKPATSREVAEYGYKQMEKGKRVAIHGFLNKLGALSIRFSPRSIVPGVVKKVQERKS